MTNKRRELNAEIKRYNERIAYNLKTLLKDRGISNTYLCNAINAEKGLSMDRTAFSKFLNHPEENTITMPFLVSCAEFLGVTLDYLVRNDNDVAQSIIAIDSLSNKTEKSQVYFISNPRNPFWEQYLQEYYCYYYSTVSEENRKEDSLISGILKLSDAGNWCKAELKIDTKKIDNNGNKIYKNYVGVAILCQATGTIQCNMRDNNIGECCYLVFRYAQVNYTKQACRIAEVLSTSSKPEKRYPVVHRMVLSKELIGSEDMKLIKPHLFLNYSKIIIGEKELDELIHENVIYEKIIEEIRKADMDNVRVVKERKLCEIAEKYLPKEKIAEFISEVRYKSLAYRYNKVSPRVDMNLWDVLSNAGYYKDLEM